MKNSLITLSAIGLLLTGCSAAYKSGQTPDDVYYSSNPKVAAVAVRHQQQPDEQVYANNDEGYQSYFSSEEDNYLKMKVANGGRWNTIDDYDYWYGYNNYSPYMSGMGLYGLNSMYYNYNMLSPYHSIGYSYGLNNFYNPYSFLNYSGYGYGHSAYYPVVINKRPTYSVNGYRPSLSAYGNNQYDRGNNGTNRNPTRHSNNNYNSYFNNRSSNSTNNSNSSQRYFNNSSNSSSTPTYSAPASSGSSRTSSGSSSSGSTSSGRGGRGGL